MLGTLVAAEFNTATMLGGASIGYSYGTVGIWYTVFFYIPAFILYTFTVAKRYRRLNINTVGEFFDQRFGGKLAELTRGVSTFITLTFTVIAPATYLAGLAVIGNILLGIPPLWVVIGLTLICLFYSLTGGLLTAISADVFAFVMIIIGLPTLFFIGWYAAGGFGSLEQVFEPEFLSFEPVWDHEQYGFGAIMAWWLQAILAYVAAPWYSQRIFSAKNEKVAFKAMAFNIFITPALYALAIGAAIFAKVLMPNLENPEEAIPTLILNYSPPIVQGLLLVTLLLVGVSTLIAIWNAGVSIFMNDLFKRNLVKNMSDKFYINASRICFVLLGMLTIVFAIAFIGSIFKVLLYMSVFLALLAFPVLAGFYWKRFNTKAALASMLVGIIYVSIALTFSFPYYLTSPVGVLLSIIAGVLVAFTTKQEASPEFIKKFFDTAGLPLFEGKKGNPEDFKAEGA